MMKVLLITAIEARPALSRASLAEIKAIFTPLVRRL